MSSRIVVSGVLLGAAIVVGLAGQVYGQAGSKLSQTISGGVLSTAFLDADSDPVSNPSFTLDGVTTTNVAQTTTGVFGDDNNRISVDDQRGNGTGWTLALAAAGGQTAVWSDGGTNSYPFNGTSTTGRLTINPSVATITPTSPNTVTGVTKGSSASFTAATPITLMQAGSEAEKIWNGYMTGVGVSQDIPAFTPPGTYTIDLTMTVANS